MKKIKTVAAAIIAAAIAALGAASIIIGVVTKKTNSRNFRQAEYILRGRTAVSVLPGERRIRS